MKIFKQILSNAFVVISASLVMTSCQKSSVNTPANVSATQSSSNAESLDTEDKGLSYPLTAGQSIPVGKIVLTKDASNVYITYVTNHGWRLQEVHAKVESSLAAMPKSNKDIAPGQFPYKASFEMTNGDVYSLPDIYTLSIPISEVNINEALIYAHAVVINCDGGDTETAWGGNIVPPNKGLKWYGYIPYSIGTVIK